MSLEKALFATAAICLVAFVALGVAVTHLNAPWWFDRHAIVLRGEALPLAIVFTTSGRAFPLFALAVTGIAIAVVTRYQAKAAFGILGLQLVSQAAVEGIKHLFARPRPDAWIFRQELGFSYPSGHATSAVVFFGSYFVLVLMSPLPKLVKIPLAALLAIWIAGIDWSRLALGAHYPTDIIGGTMFGLACACIAFAVWHDWGAFRVKSKAPLRKAG